MSLLTKHLTILSGLVLLIILTFPPPVRAQTPLVLTDDQGEYPLGLHLEILEDKAKVRTIDDIASPEMEPQFKPSQTDIPNFGFTPSAYWVRFRVRNEARTNTQWQLEVAFADMQYIDLYLPQPGQAGFEVKKTGSLFPFETRDVPHQNFIFNLPLPVQTEQTIYLRFENEGTMRLPLTLWSPAALTQKIYAEQFKHGLFYGVLLIMLGYNLFLCISLRDKGYLYYSLFLICFMLAALTVHGLLPSYLRYNPLWWSRSAIAFFSPLTFIAALQFTGTFLLAKIYTPRLHKIILALQIGLAILAVLSPFTPRRFISGPEVVLMLLSLPLIFIAGWWTWQQGYRPARYFLLAWLGFIGLSSLLFLARLGWWPINVVSAEGPRIGITLLVMLWSLALADRINLLKAETEHADHRLGESEQRFRNLVEGSIQGILVHRNTKPLFANQSYARILGYDSPDEILSMDTLLPLIAPYEQERLLGYKAARLRGEPAPSRYECDLVRQDGAIINVEHTITLIPWDGTLAELSTIIDVTERKRAEQARRESEERFRSLVEGSIQGILVHRQTKPLFVNRAFACLLGYESSAEILAMDSVVPLIAPYDQEHLVGYQGAQIKGETALVEYEFDAIRKDGSMITLHHLVTTINWAGEPAILSTVIDISERKQAEAALRESEHFNRRIAEATPHILYLFDIIEQRNLYSNRRMTDLLGYTPQTIQALGSDFLPKLLHPDDAVRLEVLFRRWDTATDGDVIETEYRMKHADGTWRWFIGSDTVFTRTGEGQVKQIIGTAQDITERKEAEQNLRFQKMLLECQSEASPDGILIVSNERKWLSFNRRFIEMWAIPDEAIESRSREEALQSSLSQLIEPEQFLTKIEYLDEHPAEYSHDELALKDGRVFERYSSPVNDENSVHYGRVWYYRDITERRQVETALRENEQKYSAIFDKSPFAIALTKMPEITTVSVNDAFLKLFEFTRAEVVGKTSVDLGITDPDARAEVAAELQACGCVRGFECTRTTKSGARRVLSLYLDWVSIGGEKHILTTVHDITERKRAEESLHESEERLRLFIEHAPAALAMFDDKMRYLAFSRRWMADYGLEGRAIIGQSHYDIFPEIPDRWKDMHRRGLAGEVVQADEDPFVRLDGVVQWLCWEVRPWYTVNGAIGGIIIFTEDITEGKQAKEALRAGEERFRQVVSSISDHIYVTAIAEDGSKTNLYLSPNIESLLGYPLETFLDNWDFWSSTVLHPDDQTAGAVHAQSLTTRGQSGEIEYRMIRADGRVIWVRDSARVVHNNGRKTIYGVVSDITERKQVEERVRQRNRELAAFNTIVAATNALFDPTYLADLLQTIVDRGAEALLANRIALITLDLARKEIIDFVKGGPGFVQIKEVPFDELWEGLSGWVVRQGQPALSPKDRPDSRESWRVRQRRMETHSGSIMVAPLHYQGKTLGSLTAINRPDEPDFSEQDVALLLTIANQATIALEKARLYRQIQQELAERKHTEETLRVSEARLAEAQRIAHLGGWERDFQTNQLSWSDEVYRIFGLTPQAFEATYETFIGYVHPGDRNFVKQALDEALGEGKAYNIEHRIVRPDGTERVVHEQAEIIFNEAGKPAGILGTVQDITERKRAEAALYKAEAKYRMLVEQLPTITFTVEYEAGVDRATYISPQVETLLGFSPAEWLADRDLWLKQTHPDDRDRILAGIQHRDTSGEPLEVEYRLLARNGEVFWFHNRSSVIQDVTGRPHLIHGVMLDITARKQAEQALRQSEEYLRSILDNVMDGIITINEQGIIKTFNPAAEKIFGYRASEITGQNIGLLMAEPDRRHHQDYLANYLRTGQAKVIGIGREVEGRRQDGSTFPLDLAVGKFYQGERCMFIGVVRDITRRKKDEKKLRESEARYRMLFESVPLPIFTKDRDGRYTSVNAENVKYWERNPVGYTDAELLPPEIAARLRANDLQVMETGQTLTVEEEFPTPYGLRYTFSHKVPLRDADGEIIGVLGGSVDITELKQTEQALRQNEAELQRRNRELSLFNQIIAASAAGMEPEAILEIACRGLALTFELPQAAAALLNEEKTAARVVAEYRAEGRPSALNQVIPVAGNPAVQYVLSHKTPLAVENAQSNPLLASIHGLMRQRGTVSLLIVPLIIAGEVMGSLGFDALETRTFSPEEINLAWSVADQVAGALARARLVQERRLLSAAVAQSAESVIITDAAGIIVYVNPAFEKVSGYSQAEVAGQTPRILKSGCHEPAFYQELWATITAGQIWRNRLIDKRKDGRLYTVDTTITPVRGQAEAIINYVALQRDVTRELELEEQFRQAQKMEAIGRLAGGVAHDFNNLLTVINGYAELLDGSYLNQNDPRLADVEQIKKAGARAALLTRQLLAFSRQQPLYLQLLNLNEVIINMQDMIRRLIGPHITLVTDLAPTQSWVKADLSQIEQVLMNLVVNARDAMLGGGKLTIKTAHVELDKKQAGRYLNSSPGPYVLLTVADTGLGMDAETRGRIFEPFFTTKGPNKGTGLGLATVYGIIEQSGGHIQVESEPGQGAIFKIYLPRVEHTGMRIAAPPMSIPFREGKETILLVEDEAGARLVARRFLEKRGYTVLETGQAEEALQLCRQYTGQIDLLITDVMMPEMNGPELVGQLTRLYPKLKVLYISGYADDILSQYEIPNLNAILLDKPFSSDALAHKVRQVLDALKT